jgi:hypothetical protein
LYYVACAIFYDHEGDTVFNAILWNIAGNFVALGALQVQCFVMFCFVIFLSPNLSGLRYFMGEIVSRTEVAFCLFCNFLSNAFISNKQCVLSQLIFFAMFSLKNPYPLADSNPGDQKAFN